MIKTVCVFGIAKQARRAVLSPLKGHSDYVMSVAFSPDGKHIASGSLQQTTQYVSGMWLEV